MSSLFPPGTMMTTVGLSPVVGGLIRTWEDDVPITWRVDDPSGLSERLGRGSVARTQVGNDRFREVGALSVTGDRGMLMLPDRFQDGEGLSGTGYDLVRASGVEDLDSDPWDDFQVWLRAVVLSAAERGDFLVVERGGWDAPPEPYALFSCRRDEAAWRSVIEAAPAPSRGQPPWPSPPDRPEGATMTAPAGRGSIGAAAIALVTAVQEWARSPLDVGITFGKTPDGPVPLDPEPAEAAPTRVSTAPPVAPSLPADLAADLEALGCTLPIRQFVGELAELRPLESQVRDTYVSLRRPDASSIAVYVHKTKVSLALDPARAEAAAGELPGSMPQPKTLSTTYLIVDEDVARKVPKRLLAVGLEAVDR